jgi:hypothetical protein
MKNKLEVAVEVIAWVIAVLIFVSIYKTLK